MKTQMIDLPNGAAAVHGSPGRGSAVVLIHGNSASSRAFSRQLDGPLGKSLRLAAIDLPGHGASGDANDPTLTARPCACRPRGRRCARASERTIRGL